MALNSRGLWKSSLSSIINNCHQYFVRPQQVSVARGIQMSSQQRAKEVLDEMKEKNPYYDKYAEKIAKLQNSSPQEFLQRMDKVDPKKKMTSMETKRTYSELLKPKESQAEKTAEIPHKKLNDIMKLELVEDKTAEEIAGIWFEYHKTKDVIAATLTVEQYEILMATAQKHPIFLLPLPRSAGFEFIMLQFASNTVHFTPLLAYQVHAENAPECLTLVHYTELKETKGIILMRGEYDPQVLTGQEAQCLANELQMFYFKNDPVKLQLLDTFTNHPAKFKHMDLIKIVENIQLV